jgi:hypothetical protein
MRIVTVFGYILWAGMALYHNIFFSQKKAYLVEKYVYIADDTKMWQMCSNI